MCVSHLWFSFPSWLQRPLFWHHLAAKESQGSQGGQWNFRYHVGMPLAISSQRKFPAYLGPYSLKILA